MGASDSIPTKTCSKCHHEFSATGEHFHKHQHGKYGLKSICKSCTHDCYRERFPVTSRRKIPPVQSLDGETVKIPLTRGYVAVVDVIDADLAEVLWSVIKAPNKTAYAYHRKPSPVVASKYELLHRRVYERVLGRALNNDEQIDHIDGNGLNCRRDNLRLATHAQNQQNKKRRRDNRSGYKGVRYIARRNKWEARIRANGKAIFLGVFDTPETAHEAYVKAARELYGEFMRSE